MLTGLTTELRKSFTMEVEREDDRGRCLRTRKTPKHTSPTLRRSIPLHLAFTITLFLALCLSAFVDGTNQIGVDGVGAAPPKPGGLSGAENDAAGAALHPRSSPPAHGEPYDKGIDA